MEKGLSLLGIITYCYESLHSGIGHRAFFCICTTLSVHPGQIIFFASFSALFSAGLVVVATQVNRSTLTKNYYCLLSCHSR